MDKRSITSKLNGAKSKGNKGYRAPHTLLAAKTKAAFVQAVHENLQDLFNALLREAKKGNIIALKEMLDRAWGKPTQPIDGGSDNNGVPLPILVKFIDDRTANNRNTD